MKNLIKTFSVLILLAVVGVGLFFGRNIFGRENPPTLSLFSDNSQYQATVIGRANGFLRFNADDVAGWRDPSGRSVNLQVGTHFYYSDEDLKITDLIDSIKPVLYNEMVVLYYSPDESRSGLNQGDGFYTFPDLTEFVTGAASSSDVYGFSNDDRFTIPAYRPFIIVAKQQSKIFSKHANIYGEDDEAPTNFTFHNPLSGGKTGWALVPVQGNNLGYLKNSEGFLDNVFIQNGENSFEEVDFTDFDDTDATDFFILWIKVKEAEVIPACDDDVDNDSDGKIDFGTGANNDPGCSSATDNDETNAPQGQTYQCNDSVDNDSDGKVDFNTTGFTPDPGCSSATDDTEADNGQPQTYQCNDGVDNDSDTKIDFGAGANNDPGCSTANDDTEVDPPQAPPTVKSPQPQVLEYLGGTIVVEFPNQTTLGYSSGITLKQSYPSVTNTNYANSITVSGGNKLNIAYGSLSGINGISNTTKLTLLIPKGSVYTGAGNNGTPGITPSNNTFLTQDVKFEFTVNVPPVWQLSCPTNGFLNPGNNVPVGQDAGIIKISFPRQAGKTLTYDGSISEKITLRRDGDGIATSKVHQGSVSFSGTVLTIPYYELVDKTANYILEIPVNTLQANNDKFLTEDIVIDNKFDAGPVPPTGIGYQNCL